MRRRGLQPYIGYNTKRTEPEDPDHDDQTAHQPADGRPVRLLRRFAADNAIQVSMLDGKQQAQFKVGDARCVLVDDQIRCTPVSQ